MQGIHGGDIYTNNIKLDFSVNLNPFGVPVGVETALHEAVAYCQAYPDIQAHELKEKMAEQFGVSKECFLFGNGASELFMGIMHALKPRKVLLPVPSFYGYEYVAKAVESEIEYFYLSRENSFLPGASLLKMLTEEIDLLFLANPNNPTGKLLERGYLKRLLEICKENGIHVVVDECFISFCEGAVSLFSEIEKYQNLLLVQAFTKSYAIPGVRLGYLMSSNHTLVQSIAKQLPEWNLSVFAQKAGIACVEETAYLAETVAYVQREREYLTDGLKKLGVHVFSGAGNFILFYTEMPLYEQLLKGGILIRDCRNFRGLSEGYYRIAVKKREENEILLREIGECFAENRIVIAGGN